MSGNNASAGNKSYITGVSVMIFVLPTVSYLLERLINFNTGTMPSPAKWFIFYAAGLRLFIAGIRQVTRPAFTAKEIFHFTGIESFAVIKELGYANICAGLVGIISLFIPAWRIVSAFSSGLYYGFAAFTHINRKPAGVNEKFALFTDVVIFVFLLVYVIIYLKYQQLNIL